jgi:hypothetical protein
MTQMAKFLSKMPYLKHLKIKGGGNMDLVDGLKWQSVVSHLTTFNFDLRISSPIDNDLLDTFRSTFWLVEKRWFIIYDKQESHIFTAPLFASRKMNYPLSTISYYSTASNIEQIVTEHVEKLFIHNSAVSPTYYYKWVKSLQLQCTNVFSSFQTLPLIVNLNIVEPLSIKNTSLSLSTTIIDQLHNFMPFLRCLTIDDTHPLLDFDHPKPIFRQIRTLKLTYKHDDRQMTANP